MPGNYLCDDYNMVLAVRLCCGKVCHSQCVISAPRMQGRGGLAPFFAGVGPRALSSGLNSAIFFCFFEALRGVSLPPCQLY